MKLRLSDITVVVPTKNERANIERFLASLPEALSLIVVDAGVDETPELVLKARPRLTHVVRGQSTIPEARQLGAELSKTDWVLFTDADVIFAENYFDSLSYYSGVDALYGTKHSLDNYRLYYRLFGYGQWLSHLFGIPAVSGSNLLVRKAVVLDVGGFDPDLVCNEDSELGWRLKRKGYNIVFARDLVVFATDHRRLERGLVRKTVHSVCRCILLWLDVIPERWRKSDWGYWSSVSVGKDRDAE